MTRASPSNQMIDPRIAYVLDYFRQLYTVPPEIEIGYGSGDKKINIVPGNLRYFDRMELLPPREVCWLRWRGSRIPVLFSRDPSTPLFEWREGRLFIQHDILASAFFFLSGWQEYVYMRVKPSLRFPYQESLQYRLGITQIPVVNYYFDILKEALQQVTNRKFDISLYGQNRAAVCLNHDIDRCASGWKEGGGWELKKGHPISALKLLVKKMAGKDVWFNFADILTLEEKYAARASYFFLPRKGKTESFPHMDLIPLAGENGRKSSEKNFFLNGDYLLQSTKFKNVFQDILQTGSEIALHGSVGTHFSLAMLQEDLARFPVPVKGVRFHNLLFDRCRTFDLLEEVGLQYDSTLGFAEEIGFRNGVAFPFQPYHFEKHRAYTCVEIPLMIMDTTFRVYKKTPSGQILPEIKKLFNEIRKFHGVMVLLWHNNYLSPYKFAGWPEIYEEILRYVRDEGMLILTAEELVSKFPRMS